MVSKFARALLNLPGWHTRRRIIVIESDDWGSVRMPSRDVFEDLISHGIDVTSGDSLRYNRYDTLAGKDDYEALFSVLRKHRDSKGNPAVLTALSLVANPDFERIRSNGFTRYHYEPITETLQRYYPQADIFSYWRRGISERLFIPEFHGREHLNVATWMRDLQRGDQHAHLGFEKGVWGFNNKNQYRISYQAAFDPETEADLKAQADILEDGLALFNELLGYKASFFVPPNGILHERHYELLERRGIAYMFSSRLHLVPAGNARFKRRFNYLGKKNRFGQRFIIRNAFFEPSQEGKDWVSSCLREIADAFRFNRPAVISSHRVNFIGALDPLNRDRGVQQLERLLSTILATWKDVEFLTSTELGQAMNVNGRKN